MNSLQFLIVVMFKLACLAALLSILCSVIWIFFKLKTLRCGGAFRNFPFYFRKRVRANSCYYRLPTHFITLLLLHEDIAFFSHGGFNFREIYNSFKRTIVGGYLKGGSSLSQQTVKLLLFYDRSTFIRKIYEIIAVLILEFFYSKEEILSIYLQVVRFGPHVFGLDEACKVFFSKSPSDLTLAESEVLVSMLVNPSRFLASLNVEPLKIYQLRAVDFRYDFALSYEKTLHALRVLQVVGTKPIETYLCDFKALAQRAAYPSCQEDQEHLFIAEATRYIHEIPQVIQRISKCNSQMPKILDAALSVDERLLVGHYLKSEQVNLSLLKQYSSAIDIEHVRMLARYHRIAQLADERSSFNDVLSIPLEDSKALLFEGTAHYLRKKSAMEMLIQRFSEHQVPFYLVRGLDLATRYYQNPAQKLFVDFDIVIDQASFLRVAQMLNDMKFTIKAPANNVSLLDQNLIQNLTRINQGVDCFSESMNIALDIHPIPSKTFVDMHLSAETVQLSQGFSYKALPWKQNVKHLMFHGKKHFWHRLCWVQDLYAVLSAGSEGDIRELHQQSKEEDWENTFLAGISLCYFFCPLKIEQQLVDLIIDRFSKDNPVFSYIQGQMFSPQRTCMQMMLNLIHRQYYERGLFKKCATICSRIFMPTKNDLFSLVLPKHLFFVYYFYRPYRILIERFAVKQQSLNSYS